MVTAQIPLQARSEEVLFWLEMSRAALKSSNLEELEACFLPNLARGMQSPSSFLYLRDPRLTASCFLQFGLHQDTSIYENLCARHYDEISKQPQPPSASSSLARQDLTGSCLLYSLWNERSCIGFVGATPRGELPANAMELCKRFVPLLAAAIDRLLDKIKSHRQLKHLNTYLTISSMLAQALGLHELMETILYSCIDVTSAEEASVLLLDDDKENFCFYQVEGSSKPLLIGMTFPADRGIAGSVLLNQRSEIINDVQSDPRFYGAIDSESGFKTTSMIAIPLTAGEERIGVLEVLNKANNEYFTEEEHLILLSIAEEIAFAIRNAKIFDYVVNSYCKQRQGQNSCKGCKRPLGSWTPCVKYREAGF